jgi:hypothetical protein
MDYIVHDFFFAEIIQLLVDEKNRYYKEYAETLDKGPDPCMT